MENKTEDTYAYRQVWAIPERLGQFSQNGWELLYYFYSGDTMTPEARKSLGLPDKMAIMRKPKENNMKDKDKLYISRRGEINSKEGWLKWGQESSDFIGAVFDRKTKNTVYITMPWEKIVRLLKLEEYYE